MSFLAVIKVNFTLEQAIGPEEEQRYSYTLFLTSAIDGGG
jgi:hypothetical protein